ncbi:MAG: F-box protein [Tatlockia sp.]|nr:F-box protein [Tatlockia sp.]
MLITNDTYIQALKKLKQSYSDLPWYQRWWFTLWSYSLSNALSSIDSKKPTIAQVDQLFKASDEAWFFKSIFERFSIFKTTIQGMSFFVKEELSYSGQPEELKQQIGNYSPLKDLQALACTSKTHHQLFKPLLNVRRFLRDVVQGDYDQVEARLMDNINYLTTTWQVTDCSGRTFFNISGFQYALWALDKHMWLKMLNCLPHKEEDTKVKALLLKQYQALKENGVTYKLKGKIITERHFDFENTLIRALRTQVNDANKRIKSWSKIDEQWREDVGSAQKLLPMHVIYEYCSEEPFHPLPAFIERPPMNRLYCNRIKNKWRNWSHADSRLGVDFAIFKGGQRWAEGHGGRVRGGYLDMLVIATRDLRAIETLYDLRTAEFISLEFLLRDPLEFNNQSGAYHDISI